MFEYVHSMPTFTFRREVINVSSLSKVIFSIYAKLIYNKNDYMDLG